MSELNASSHFAGVTTASGSAVGVKATCAVVFAMGAALVFLVGFAQADVLHDAAHDTRHGLAFPCH